MLEPSYFRIPNSNVHFRNNRLHTNSQIVCQSHEVSEITCFMKSWSTNSIQNSVNRFYESMKGKNHSPRMMQDIFIKAKVQEWQMLFKVIFIKKPKSTIAVSARPMGILCHVDVLFFSTRYYHWLKHLAHLDLYDTIFRLCWPLYTWLRCNGIIISRCVVKCFFFLGAKYIYWCFMLHC